ncbi:arylsulfatase [Mariniblastus fucicola]|uniref:Arylsulfatase n=1 Tax=Mariniblastus fucicola TaxID=980251 RepID=A0A5B9PGF6_9BACT|nr:arylsulfatase [Mariniblastus fucicola]QEG24315.1 Arylsulfatase [Mariniblastus fucicola]
MINFQPHVWLVLFALTVPWATAELAHAQDEEPKKRPPNVIFILADDLGYGDLSCYGQEKFETPHIDSLARRGIKFTQHYSGSTVCAPSRCCLLTGFHTGHAVVRGNAEVKPEGQEPMPADTLTVAHLMKEAGYKTGVFGKWGLGAPGSASEPLKMGFDRFYGYNCQRIAHCYYPAFVWDNGERQLLIENAAQKNNVYAPKLIQEQALNFIRENKEEPFFLYYAAVQPHADMIAPPSYMKKHRGKYGPEKPHTAGHYHRQEDPHAAFGAMINVLDDYVGEINAELNMLGLADETLIIFTSDNGPHVEGGHDPEYFNSNGNLRGTKRDLYEGGTRVPMIACWPGKIKPDVESDHVSAFWDFLPTMAELTEQAPPVETDGISMLPTLLGQPGQGEHEYLYWEFAERKGRVAIRKGDWKGVRYNASIDPHSPLELYDLSTDPGEEINIANKHPEIVSELRNLVESARTTPDNPRFDYLRKRNR